jgi:hypothetical protein
MLSGNYRALSDNNIPTQILAGAGCTRRLDTGGWPDTTVRPTFSNETQMNDQILEEAERLFEKKSKPAPTSYEQEQLAMRANFERLKQERLEREAAAK